MARVYGESGYWFWEEDTLAIVVAAKGSQKNQQPIFGIKKLHLINAMESKFIFK